MKKIEDCLHYYLGQKVLINNRKLENVIDTLTYINHLGDCGGNEYEWLAKDCQLILRKLEDMTEEEEEEYTKTVDEWNFGFKRNMLGAATSTHFLLSRGFDLFKLIESGLSIDSNSLTNQTPTI